MYWRFGQQWAIRHGDMKLVVARGGSGKPELYDLAADFSESKDLAAEKPDEVKKLQALWDKWSAEQAPPSAIDTPNGNARPNANRPNANRANGNRANANRQGASNPGK
jgi:arylsulfatase A-like enzyme